MTTAIFGESTQAKYFYSPPVDNPRVYRCHLAILKDAEDEFSVLVLNLPGSGSSATTEKEAITRAKEAVAGVIASYNNQNEEIPWLSSGSYEIPEGAKSQWVIVDA